MITTCLKWAISDAVNRKVPGNHNYRMLQVFESLPAEKRFKGSQSPTMQVMYIVFQLHVHTVPTYYKPMGDPPYISSEQGVGL